MRFRGRLGNPTETIVCNDRVSETPWGIGGSGLFGGAGFCERADDLESEDNEGELLPTRRNSRCLGVVGGASESSLELEERLER